MEKMTLQESVERIVWTDLVCEGIVLDRENKTLAFNTMRYDWTENREFLAEEGWLYFENLVDIEIEAEPKTTLDDLKPCRLGFTSYKLLLNGIELEAVITGNRYYQFCEIDWLLIRIFAQCVV